MESTVGLRLLEQRDWQVLRAARLMALLDSPDAFTSSFACESKWAEPDWRRMLHFATWVVAHQDETVIGLARSIREPEQPTACYVESIWVAPTHRRQGVLRALLQDLARREQRKGVTDLLLWVLENNDQAQFAYHALGFKATGQQQPLAEGEGFEHQLRLSIGRLLESKPIADSTEICTRSSKPHPRPSLQPQEVHSFTSPTDIVHTIGELLPVNKIRPPGIEEAYAEASVDRI